MILNYNNQKYRNLFIKNIHFDEEFMQSGDAFSEFSKDDPDNFLKVSIFGIDHLVKRTLYPLKDSAKQKYLAAFSIEQLSFEMNKEKLSPETTINTSEKFHLPCYFDDEDADFIFYGPMKSAFSYVIDKTFPEDAESRMFAMKLYLSDLQVQHNINEYDVYWTRENPALLSYDRPMPTSKGREYCNHAIPDLLTNKLLAVLANMFLPLGSGNPAGYIYANFHRLDHKRLSSHDMMKIEKYILQLRNILSQNTANNLKHIKFPECPEAIYRLLET